jgi:hypothetical protein
MEPLTIIIVLALIATVATMFLGLMVMSGGGETDRWLSTRFMWLRVGIQAFTMLLLFLALYLRR